MKEEIAFNVIKQLGVHVKFNHLIIMENNPWSWYSVSAVRVGRLRCYGSNYYLSSRSPIGKDYFNASSSCERPEQGVRLALAWADNKVRQTIRFVLPSGLGKNDLYQGSGR